MGFLFTNLLTYGGAAAALLNPWTGVLVYVCFAILRPPSLWFWSVAPGNYSQIIGFAMIAGWGLKGFGSWNFGRGQTILLMLLAFLGWAAVSAAFADNQSVGIAFVVEKGKIVLPCLIALTLCDSVVKLKTLVCTIALCHGYIAMEFNTSYFGGYNRMELNGLGSMDNNSLAISLVAATGFAFFLGISESTMWRKLLFFGSAALLTHAVFFSFSRGAMAALIAVGIVSAIILPKQPKHYVMFALGAVLALRMAGPGVIARFSTTLVAAEERDGSAQSRVDMWGICWQQMLQNPVVGIGPDHFPLKAAQFGLSAGKEAHTLWLQVGAELGFPGLFFLAMFYLLTLLGMWRFLHKSPHSEHVDPFMQFVPHMVISSLVGFILAAQFVSLEGLEAPYYIAICGACFLKLQSQNVPASAHPWAVPVSNYHTPYPQPFMHRGR